MYLCLKRGKKTFIAYFCTMGATIYKDSIEITASKELKLFVRSMAATYRFVFQQQKYDLVRRADMLELVDLEQVGQIAVRFATTLDNAKMVLTRSELYTFYTMLELVCRSFLTEISDEYKAIALSMNKVDEKRYNQVRSTELSIAQTLIQQVQKDFKDDPEFEEIAEKLEMLD